MAASASPPPSARPAGRPTGRGDDRPQRRDRPHHDHGRRSQIHVGQFGQRRAHHPLARRGPALYHGRRRVRGASARNQSRSHGGPGRHAHQDDERPPCLGQGGPVDATRPVPVAHPAGHHRDRRGQAALSDRDAGGGRNPERGRHARDHLPRHAGRGQHLDLLAAPSEEERVASLETHHHCGAPAVVHQQASDLLLALAPGPDRRVRVLAHVDQLRRRRREVEEGRRHQSVVEDDVGPGQQLRPAARQQPGVTRAGADEVDGHS